MTYLVGRCLLRYRLQDRNMTQQDLANKLSVSKQQISKYARNEQKMSMKVAGNVAIILGCHIEDLYEWIKTGDNE